MLLDAVRIEEYTRKAHNLLPAPDHLKPARIRDLSDRRRLEIFAISERRENG